MNLRLYIILLAFAGCMSCIAQSASDALKPQWLHKLPSATNATFIYEIVPSSARNLEDARKLNVKALIEDAGMKSGVVIVSDHKATETVSQVWENGKLKEVIKNDMQTINTSKGHEVPLHASFVDEYWNRDDNGVYHLQRLYMKSELGKMPLYDDVELTTSYASEPATWGLALIPGAAQFHKRTTLKGGLILGGTVALAGGVIYTETMRKDYMNKIKKTHNTENMRTYKTRADNFAMGRNICIGAVAALYVYNLIDAIVAPGARRIVVHRNSRGSGYTVLPSVTSEGQPALFAQITF